LENFSSGGGQWRLTTTVSDSGGWRSTMVLGYQRWEWRSMIQSGGQQRKNKTFAKMKAAEKNNCNNEA